MKARLYSVRVNPLLSSAMWRDESGRAVLDVRLGETSLVTLCLEGLLDFLEIVGPPLFADLREGGPVVSKGRSGERVQQRKGDVAVAWGTGPRRRVTPELREALSSQSPILPTSTHVALTPTTQGTWLVTQWNGETLVGWIRCNHREASLIARYGVTERS